MVLFVVDASVGLTDDDQTIANWIRRTKTPGGRRGQQVRQRAARDRDVGVHEPRARRARAGERTARPTRRRPARRRARPVPRGDAPTARRTRTTSGCRRPPTTSRRGGGAAAGRDRRAARTSARARCSTGWSARTARSSTTSPARPATRSTRSSTPTTARSCSSTPPACAARRRSTTRRSTTRSCGRCGRSTTPTSRCSIIDATVGVTAQDQRLAERVDAAGCPTVLVLNKWELVGTEERLEVQGEVRRMLGFVGDAPVLKISALTGKNVDKLHPLLQEAISQYHTRVPTTDVNRIIAAAQQRNPAPRRRQDPVRRAGCDRPADVHAVRQPGDRSAVPALHRADDPRGVRPRLDGDEDPGPQA